MIKYEPWMDKEKALDLASRRLLEVSSEDISVFMVIAWNDGFDEGYDTGREDGYAKRDEELRQE